MAYKPNSQPKETRVNNTREVSLGFAKKIAQDESRRCPQCAQPTCLVGCPLGVDIPGFIRFLREADASSALARIKQNNPFPAICGRICPAPCEPACIFEQDKDTISIRLLERFAADHGQVKNDRKVVVESKGKKVAIIGSGPSGLTAAFWLAKAGYGVTVYESMDEPGGILRYGIPEFRLPQKVLEDQIAELKAMGIDFVVNAFVGRTVAISEILMQGFGVVLLAVGASVPDFAEIQGENLGGVFYAEEFLLRLHNRSKLLAVEEAQALVKGKQTLILGGGSAAIDAARLAIRLGQQVRIVFPGLEEQMEVSSHEMAEALEEGIVVDSLVEPLSIVGDEHGFVSGVTCRKLEIEENEGALKLKPSVDPRYTIEAQAVILAHGRKPNSFLKHHMPQLKFNDNGSLWVNAQGMTSVDKVFGCGNVVSGAGSILEAMVSGKAAAESIMAHLGG